MINSESSLNTNTIYRYYSANDPSQRYVDGFDNYLFYTKTKNENKALLESGINPIAGKFNDNRVPAILLHSNPIKAGTEDTPWQDIIDADNGYVKYFGDNKSNSFDSNTPRNKKLIEQYNIQNQFDVNKRKLASPIIIFENITVNGVSKGYKKFIGYGIISKVQYITQFDSETNKYFPNYVFDIILLNLDNEQFDWKWISDRRNNTLNIDQTLNNAPNSWKKWLKKSNYSFTDIQRKVYKSSIILPKNQKTKYDKTIKDIYDYYLEPSAKYNFQFLAAFVTEKIINDNGGNYKFEWITPKGLDSGVGFVGKISIGKGFSLTNIVVIGQAKHIKIENNISAIDLARTVARLKRGWIGSFVTTGTFSESAQKEMIGDKYPILLINGETISEIVKNYMFTEGFKKTSEFLNNLDNEYKEKISSNRPEQLFI